MEIHLVIFTALLNIATWHSFLYTDTLLLAVFADVAALTLLSVDATQMAAGVIRSLKLNWHQRLPQ